MQEIVWLYFIFFGIQRGVASLHIDSDLAPYVKKSFSKYYADGLWWVEGIRDANLDELVSKASVGQPDHDHLQAYDFAVAMLEREGKQASEALYHNLNTLIDRGLMQATA